MTQQHPITPPPSELVLQWIGEHFDCTAGGELSDLEHFLTIRAAQWGADQELEACCEWLQDPDLNVDTYKLRAARRPKPPSLKEQALALIDECTDPEGDYLDDNALATIRRALEQLPDSIVVFPSHC
jgi:hypothetical protein